MLNQPPTPRPACQALPNDPEASETCIVGLNCAIMLIHNITVGFIMKKQILGLGLALACAATSAYADEVKLKFLNCTGNTLTVYWTGYKVNIDHEASYDVIQGQISLPGGSRVVDKTLSIYRANSNGSTTDEHLFTMDFVQGVYGNVFFGFTQYLTNDRQYGNRIKITSNKDSIYVPNIPIEVTNQTTPAPIVDIRIGC